MRTNISRPWWMTNSAPEPLGDIRSDRLWPELPRTGSSGSSLVPVCSIYEKDGRFYVTAELPGVRREDITVSMEDNILTITAGRDNPCIGEDTRYLLCESCGGTLERSLWVPAEIDASAIETSFENGVLTVTLVPVE